MSSIVLNRWQKVLIAIAACSSLQLAWAQENNREHLLPKSNLEIMQHAVQQITGNVLDSVRLNIGDSIAVRVQPHAESWIVAQAATATLIAHKLAVFSYQDSSTSSKYLFHVPSILLQVHYNNMFKDGIFGSKRVERRISVQLSILLQNQVTNEILHSGTLSQSYSDTVAVDDIERIENEGLNVTHGELPSETFLDRFIEPFVIIGATGVAIYLLFNIRS